LIPARGVSLLATFSKYNLTSTPGFLFEKYPIICYNPLFSKSNSTFKKNERGIKMIHTIHDLEKIDNQTLKAIIICVKISQKKEVIIESCEYSPFFDQLQKLSLSILKEIIFAKLDQKPLNIQKILQLEIRKNQTVKDYLNQIHDLIHQLNPNFIGISYEEIITFIINDNTNITNHFDQETKKLINQEYFSYQEKKLLIIQKFRDENIESKIITPIFVL